VRNLTFTANPYKVVLRNTSMGGPASVAFSCSTSGLYATTGQTVTSIQYFTPGSCTITLSKPDPRVGYGAEVQIIEMVPTQISQNQTVGGLRIKKITNTPGIGMTPVVTDYDYNLSYNGHSSGILYSKPTYVQILKNTGSRYSHQTLFANGATWYLDAEDPNPVFWPYFNGGNLSSIKSASALLPMSTTQGNHIGYNEVKVSQSGNGYSIYRYYGSDVWDLDVRDVCTRILDKTTPNSAPEYPAAPLPFDYKRGELKYEGHFDQSNHLLKEIFYYPVYQNSQVTTPGIRTYSIYSGMLVTSAKTEFELNSAKKTEFTKTERTFDPSTGNYLETTSTTLYESPYHAEATSFAFTNSKNESVQSKTKYSFDFKAPGCPATNTCWSNYQSTLQNNLNLYSSEYNQCTDNNCRMLARAMYLSRNRQARRDYASCREQSIAAYNSCFQTAKSQANIDLKPIYDMEDKFINAPIESTEWKNSKLAKATFNKYDYATAPAGFPYPSKLQVIELNSTLSPTFTVAAVNGSVLTKDIRYSDNTTVKYENGELIEVTPKNGVTTSYLWGYNNTLPIAKAIGTNYSTLVSAYNAVGQNLSQLRTYSTLANAFVSTYVYTPGVGIISETDPRGRNSYYEYDKLNRLVLMRDHDNNILKKICYNYQGQPESCPLGTGNAVKTGTFTRNNCGTGYTGSTVTYTVPANTYFGPNADALAQADVNNNGQAYANAHGTCTQNSGGSGQTVYARMEVSISDTWDQWGDYQPYYDGTQYDFYRHVSIYVRFYSDAACTTRATLTSNTDCQINSADPGYFMTSDGEYNQYRGAVYNFTATSGTSEVLVDESGTFEYFWGFQNSSGDWNYYERGRDDYELVSAGNCTIATPVYPTHTAGY
jgi:hypothetical protein